MSGETTGNSSKSASAAAIFEAPKLAVDRLPQLRALFERTSTGCVEEFKSLFTAPVTCFLNQVEAGDSWDLLDGREECIAALFYVAEWDTQFLMAMERRLLYTAIDAMFGGDGSEPPIEAVQPLTLLEMQIARNVFELTAGTFRTAFEPLSELTISLERIETEVEFTILGPQNIPSVFAQLLFQVFDNGGRLFILVPRAPLMPLRKKLERGTLREAQSEDPRWTRQLQSRLSGTPVPVRAIAAGPIMNLGEIAMLKVGQVIPVEAISKPEIVLVSGETPIFKCALGQIEGQLSVRIDSNVEAPKGLAENVLTEAMRGWSSANSPVQV